MGYASWYKLTSERSRAGRSSLIPRGGTEPELVEVPGFLRSHWIRLLLCAVALVVSGFFLIASVYALVAPSSIGGKTMGGLLIMITLSFFGLMGSILLPIYWAHTHLLIRRFDPSK